VPNSSTKTARRLRALHRSGRLSHAHYAVADALLWSCGTADNPYIQVSYDRLAQLAGVARSTVAEALRVLKKLGVLAWRQTRIRVKWRSLVWRNVYQFLTGSDEWATESRPVKKTRGIEGGLGRLGYHPPVRTVAEQLAMLR
jgi:hypothetical protein